MMGCKKCYISNAVNVPDDMLWSGSEEDGNNRSVRKVKVLWRWRWWHWLVKVDRSWHTFCIKCIKFIVKYFTFTDVFYLVGGRPKVELSCIWVNMVINTIINNQDKSDKQFLHYATASQENINSKMQQVSLVIRNVGSFYETTWYYTPEVNIHIHCHNNLSPHTYWSRIDSKYS